MKLGSNKKSNEIVNASKVTVLSLGFELTGDVISKNDIRADGVLRGNIRTDKKVVVGEEASVYGDIVADEISISGEVVGDLYINGETTIYPTAKVSGNILTNQIFIHKGAQINSCIKTASTESIQKETEKEPVPFKTMATQKTIAPKEFPEEKEKPHSEVKKQVEEINKEKAEEVVPLVNKNFHRSW